MLTFFFNVRKLTHPLDQYPRLEEFLALRSLGASYGVLAAKFGIEKTTVRYICRRFGLAGAKNPPIRHKTTTSKPLLPSYDEEKVNPGRTYADYLKIEQKRKWNRLTQKSVSR